MSATQAHMIWCNKFVTQRQSWAAAANLAHPKILVCPYAIEVTYHELFPVHVHSANTTLWAKKRQQVVAAAVTCRHFPRAREMPTVVIPRRIGAYCWISMLSGLQRCMKLERRKLRRGMNRVCAIRQASGISAGQKLLWLRTFGCSKISAVTVHSVVQRLKWPQFRSTSKILLH